MEDKPYRDNVYMVRCGETALKGRNKPYFERMLIKRIKQVLKDAGNISAERRDGLILVRAEDDASREEILSKVGLVFGVDSVSPALELDIEGLEPEEVLSDLGEAAAHYICNLASERGIKTFKVDAKRADKTFPVISPEIARRVGGSILRNCSGLKVDLHSPECLLFVSVRRGYAYVYEEKVKGLGGLPPGTNGRGLVLLSGGIDSPVAAFMMARRGMNTDLLHFHSYPYTSRESEEKVKDLARRLSLYCGRMRFFSINILPAQEAIAASCPTEHLTVLVRRFMMKIGCLLAEDIGAMALITGESLGQVASQTAEGIAVTDDAASIPVFRPLIGMDKTDIIDVARKIGTYDISILPYEDCCTVFLPKHPATRPALGEILNLEARLDSPILIEAAMASLEKDVIM